MRNKAVITDFQLKLSRLQNTMAETDKKFDEVHDLQMIAYNNNIYSYSAANITIRVLITGESVARLDVYNVPNADGVGYNLSEPAIYSFPVVIAPATLSPGDDGYIESAKMTIYTDGHQLVTHGSQFGHLNPYTPTPNADVSSTSAGNIKPSTVSIDKGNPIYFDGETMFIQNETMYVTTVSDTPFTINAMTLPFQKTYYSLN